MELQRLEQAIEDAGMPEEARRRADEEMTRMKTTPVESGEYSVIRNYLDWLTSLPWSRSSKGHSDLARAARVDEGRTPRVWTARADEECRLDG